MTPLVIESCSKKHLMELGFVPGTPVYIISKAFGMVIVYFRGAKFALRKEDFESIKFYDSEFI
jgi:Fe2+ transport system protein FeoA